MSAADLQSAYALIAQHIDLAKFEGPKPEKWIRSAEVALGLQFPPTYRDFLSRLGSGRFGSDEFYGLQDERFRFPHEADSIARTLHERNEHGLPPELIAIYEPGDGTIFTLDSSRPNSSGEYPIVEWAWSDLDRVKISEDFGAFFLMIVKEVLTDENRT